MDQFVEFYKCYESNERNKNSKKTHPQSYNLKFKLFLS